MADTVDFSWDQGADLVLSFVYSVGNPPVPLDLTGSSVRMDVVTSIEPPGDRLLTYNSDEIADVDPFVTGDQPDTEIEATLGVDGTVTIVLSRDVTLPGGVLYALTNPTGNTEAQLSFPYDIFLRDGTTGRQTKILKGNLNIERSATLWQ